MMENEKIYNLIILILLIASIVLQFLCLVTPGWAIVKETSTTKYSGIFYETKCYKVTDECETLSFHEKYTTTPYSAAYSHSYLYLVRTQIFMLVIFVSTILCLVGQVYRRRCRSPPWMVLAVSCLMTMASSFMISNLSVHYVSISMYSKIYEGSSTAMGFPYCVMLYTLAWVLNILIVLVIIWEFHKYQQGYPIAEQQHGMGGIVLATRNSAEMAPILRPSAKTT